MCNNCEKPTTNSSKRFRIKRKAIMRKKFKIKRPGLVNRPKMKVLELFAGTGSVKKVCDELGWECVSVDLSSQFHPVDYEVDILSWDYTTLAKDFDIVWASPPCATFSKVKTSHLGRMIKGSIFTEERRQKEIKEIGLPLLQKAIEIITYFNPKYYFIENPQTGDMKKYMKSNHYDVDYCMFSDWGYRKRTRFWTNIEFEDTLCNRKCGNMLEGSKKHKVCVIEQKDSSLAMKYRIPPRLIKTLFSKTC